MSAKPAAAGRSWLRGQTNVSKAHTLKCAAYNLGLLLRKVWGMSKPRSAEMRAAGLFLMLWGLGTLTVVITGGTTDRHLRWLLDPWMLFLVTGMTISGVHSINTFWKRGRLLPVC
jgi:hypothetical protein